MITGYKAGELGPVTGKKVVLVLGEGRRRDNTLPHDLIHISSPASPSLPQGFHQMPLPKKNHNAVTSKIKVSPKLP